MNKKEEIEEQIKLLESKAAPLKVKSREISEALYVINMQLKVYYELLKDTVKKEKDIEITDHACMRYLKRVRGFQFGPLKNSMIPPYIRSKINKAKGTGIFKTPTHRVVVKNYIIMTILT